MNQTTSIKGKVLSKLAQDTGSELRKHNQRYSALVERSVKNGTISKTRAKRLIAVRKRYFALARKIPFVRELLSKKESFTITIGGKPQNYTLLKTGIAFEGLERPVVMVLNAFGKGQLFYKSTGQNSKKPKAWLPFRGIEYTEINPGKKDWWYQKYAGHPNFPEHFVAIGREIAKREGEIDFKRKWNTDQVEAMKQYFA